MGFLRARRTTRAHKPALGRFFLVMVVLVLLMAWNTGNQLLYILFAGLVSMLAISAAWSRLFGVRGVRARRSAPYAVTRSEPFWVRVQVENTRRFGPVYGLRVESASARNGDGAYISYLLAHTAALVNVRGCITRRGLHRLPPLELSSTYPFGLSRRVLVLDDPVEVIVYPRVHAVRPAALERFHAGHRFSRSAAADGDEFFSLREYVVGDDLRRIAWRVSARTGRWIVREMAHDQSRFVVFLLDTRRMDFLGDFDGLFEEAVELVASLGTTLLRQNYRVGVVTSDGSMEPGEGTAHELRLLDMLARVEPVAPDAPGHAPPRLAGAEMESATLVFVSPDPAAWGGRDTVTGARILHPGEVVHV